MITKRIVPLEKEEQASLTQYLDLQPWSKGRWAHIANERWLQKEAWYLKNQGVKQGLPDVIFLYPVYKSGVHFKIGMVIELKRIRASPSCLSKNQIHWLKLFNDSHFRCRVSCGWEDAAEALRSFALDKNIGNGNIEIPYSWPLGILV